MALNPRISLWASLAISVTLMSAVAAPPAVGRAAPAMPAAPSQPVFTVNAITDVPASFADDSDFTKCHTGPDPNTTCTLRAAIMNANRFAGGGATINIPSGTYVLALTPPGTPDDSAGGLLIKNDMSIVGAGAAGTIVDGGALGSVFTIQLDFITKFAPTVSITGITIRNGKNKFGGGISNGGTLVLDHSLITGNVSPSGNGGGIYSTEQLTLNHSTVSDNQALASFGGGIEVEAGNASLADSTVRDNQAAIGAGITIQTGNVTLANSTVSGNFAQTAGGGIYVSENGALTVTNSTISNNSVSQLNGGGVLASGLVSFFHSTIAGNLVNRDGAGSNSATGGGIFSFNGAGPVKLYNTLLAENYVSSTANECATFIGSLISQDYNYLQTTAGCNLSGVTTHNVTGGDPLLGPLQDNGGQTFTRALLAGSPSIDQIPPGLCRDQFGTAPVPDQRGVARPAGPLCDIGAYEGAQPTPLFNRNLVRNGDAEDAAGSPNGIYVGTPSWLVILGEFTAVPYNSPLFPSVTTDPVPANHGYNFFAGGDATTSVAVQSMDIHPVQDAVDGGHVPYQLSADLGGFSDQEDNATLTLLFFDFTVSPIGSPVTIGPVTASDRGGLTGLLHRSATGLLPVGTRYLQVMVTMNTSGGYNDGYADNLSLVLSPPPLFLPLVTK